MDMTRRFLEILAPNDRQYTSRNKIQICQPFPNHSLIKRAGVDPILWTIIGFFFEKVQLLCVISKYKMKLISGEYWEMKGAFALLFLMARKKLVISIGLFFPQIRIWIHRLQLPTVDQGALLRIKAACLSTLNSLRFSSGWRDTIAALWGDSHLETKKTRISEYRPKVLRKG